MSLNNVITLNEPLRPNLSKLYKLLNKVNDNGWYTNFGPLHDELTEKLEEYLQIENMLLVNNGTSALQVGAKALHTKETLSTPFSFVATVSSLSWQGVKNSFSDIDPHSLNLLPDSVEACFKKGCNADTVVATHVYGNPCDVKRMSQLSKQYNFKILYDASHAFGINVNESSVLKYGDASTLSFHATKLFHTVEGGAIIFKDKTDFDYAKELVNFGIRNGEGIIATGTNAKFSEYQAAVGLVNLEIISDIIERRAEIFDLYRSKLKDVIELPVWHANASKNGAYMPILLHSKIQRENLERLLLKSNIQCRNYFSPSLDKVFKGDFIYSCKNSHIASNRVLSLPMHAYLTNNEINHVVEKIKSFFRNH